jgi:hypothetical protein
MARQRRRWPCRSASDTLVVRIPDAVPAPRGRMRIVALNGSAITPNFKPYPHGTLVKALAWAWCWRRMLDDGVHATVREIGAWSGRYRRNGSSGEILTRVRRLMSPRPPSLSDRQLLIRPWGECGCLEGAFADKMNSMPSASLRPRSRIAKEHTT